jgi:hypothetical protein
MVLGFVLAASAVTAAAQEAGYRAVDNPFQDGFEFVVNSELQPMVEIAGVRWTRFGLHVKGDREIVSEKEMPVTVQLAFVNTNSDGVRTQVIALLEDAHGNVLERVECTRFSANNDRLKESIQKFKIPGAILERMSRVYLFCEIEQ